MDLSASLENYLEVIASLSASDGYALSNDIAEKMNVKRSSVTVALRNLSDYGLISYQKYKPITLTPKGTELANEIIHKHNSVKKFFIEILGVKEEQADDLACKMEHFIGTEVTERLIAFTDYILYCPRTGREWINEFESYLKDGRDEKKCDNCMKRF